MPQFKRLVLSRACLSLKRLMIVHRRFYRRRSAVQHHIEELAKEGVPPPKKVPEIFVSNPSTL
jgi:hypothetical protein